MPPTTPPAFASAGSIAAHVRALAGNAPASQAFRDAACATLRLSRARGEAECNALGQLFEEPITDDRRTLVLDLLASAGTPEAQIVMRRLLALQIARRESRTFAIFVQRLGFVERPDALTLRFLMSVYAESQHEATDVRAACAYALGAGVGRAHVWGLADAARRASDVLRRDLLSATSATDKCALLAALGTAGLDADVDVVLRFVTDEDPRVRGAAALALRKMHTSSARVALLALLLNADRFVADSALSALFEQSLTETELVRLAELVLAGRTALSLDSRVLRLIITQRPSVARSTEPDGTESARRVDDAVQLLLSRIESQALRASGERKAQIDAQSLGGPPSAARRIPMPKTPLPYAAGYRMVVEEEPSGVYTTGESARAIANPIKPLAVIR